MRQLPDSVANDTITRHRYQTVARRKLNANIKALFQECTAYALRVKWTPPLNWETSLPFVQSPLCACASAAEFPREKCRDYARQCLWRTMQHPEKGCTFVCPFGVHMHWIALEADGMHLGILYFCEPAETTSAVGLDPASTGTGPSLPAHFRLGGRLLRLVRDNLCASVLAEIRQSTIDVLTARIETQKRLAALHARTDTRVTLAGGTRPNGQGENHREQIVHRILTHVNEHYDQALTLQQFSDHFGISLAHLSTIFSQTVGMPFRSYVKQLRLEHAEKFLCDPTLRISEVAYASGYSDPNRFRLDFKARTGLSPSAWRDTIG